MSCSNRALRLKFSDPFPVCNLFVIAFVFVHEKLSENSTVPTQKRQMDIFVANNIRNYLFSLLFSISGPTFVRLYLLSHGVHDQAHNGVHFAANAGVRHSRQKDLVPFDRPHSDHSNQHEQLSLVYDYSGHGKQAYHHG